MRLLESLRRLKLSWAYSRLRALVTWRAVPHTDFEGFVNDKGVETELEAYNTILGYRDCGFMKELDTFECCWWYLGSDPVLSKFGCAIQERRNHITGEDKIK